MTPDQEQGFTPTKGEFVFTTVVCSLSAALVMFGLVKLVGWLF